MPELVSQAEYARRRGVSKVAVHNAVKAGRISLVDGKVDVERANQSWAAQSRARVGSQPAKVNVKPSAPEVPPEPPPTDTPIETPANYFEERARRERAMADQAEMEAAKMRGQLVPADDVARQWAVEAARIREQLLQFAERMAPLLEMRPLGFVRQKLDAEVRQMLEGLAA